MRAGAAPRGAGVSTGVGRGFEEAARRIAAAAGTGAERMSQVERDAATFLRGVADDAVRLDSATAAEFGARVSRAMAGAGRTEDYPSGAGRRALEAGLLIDEPFLHTALIARYPFPEQLFGPRQLRAYQEARAYTRRYGDRELTPAFMASTHRWLSRLVAPEHGGVLAERARAAPNPRPLTERERAFVEANPHLELTPPGTYPMMFGGIRYRVSSQRQAHAELSALSDWYNGERGRPGTDPYRLAAELQQRFVSIHPWNFDFNGRSSRLLMNWSLENSGLPPSAPRDFDRDLFSTPAEWTAMVREGSTAHAERAARLAELGPDPDPLAVYGLERERERFLADGMKAPDLTPGTFHDIETFRWFLSRARGNGP